MKRAIHIPYILTYLYMIDLYIVSCALYFVVTWQKGGEIFCDMKAIS